MSTTPNSLPPGAEPAAEPAKKPIEKRTLTFIVVGLVAIAAILTTVVSWFTTSQPATAQPGEVQMATTRPAVTQFAGDVDRARQIITKNASDAAKVLTVSSALHAQLPPCNADTRSKLNGGYFLLHSNTTDVPDANFVCGQDDQWVALPPAVGQLAPETTAQANAEAKSTQTGELSGAEKRKIRREAAFQSSAIPIHFADAASTKPIDPQSAAEPESSADCGQDCSTVDAAAADRADHRAGGHAERAESTVPLATVLPPTHPASPEEELGVKLSSYTGPRYPVFQGRIIEGLLVNRLIGDQGGPVKVQITTPVYSQDRQHLLIPPGSTLLGEATRVAVANEQRMAVVFHRIIMPDAWSFLLEPTKGLDQQGASGLTGMIDRHLLSLISTAVLVGAIEGLSDFTSVGSGSAVVEVQSGLSRESSTEAMQIFRTSLNRPNGITVYEGSRVRIWVARDQALPDYQNHEVKATVE